MIRMVNKLTGGPMWVAEDRIDEYLAAGHTFAVPPLKDPPATPVKRPPKKTAKKAEA